MNSEFEVTFLGTNGSCAYNGGDRVKYGSNTLCVAVKVGGETLIFDAGSGICGFHELAEYQRKHMRLFFSHHHVDHFNGLLFFSELFEREKRFDIYGGGCEGRGFYDIVDGYLSAPLSPVGIEAFNAKIEFHMLAPNMTLNFPGGVSVRTHLLSHPSGTLGYRVEYAGKAFCYCTDIELADHKDDGAFLQFTHGAELLVLDAFFQNDAIAGWGHSNWRECAEWARYASVKKMALFHYGFALSDAEIDELERKAQAIFPCAFASADRMRIVL